MHLSQSAMSSALGRLRDHLGDPLLIQSGRAMVPTAYGEALARGVREILVQVDATLNARPRFDPLSSARHFVIAASDYAINVLLLEVQRRLNRQAPGVSLEILPVRESALASLQRGEIDFVIIPDRYQFTASPSAELFRDRLVCIAARENNAIGDTVSMDQFVSLDHVTYQPDPGHVIAFDEWLREHYHVQPAVRLSMPSYSLLPLAISGTGRIATVPARMAEIYCRSLPLRVVTPTFELPPMIELLQWHKSRLEDSGLSWLRQIIVAAAGELATEAAPAAQPRSRKRVRKARRNPSPR
jgi:DNA-binding transcriptional LysR family regulator